MEKAEYSYHLRYGRDAPNGLWAITKRAQSFHSVGDPEVWTCPHDDSGDDGQPPAALRAKFEELIGWTPPVEPPPSPANIVEMIADGDDCAFDQPCMYGHRVEGHAVYCHNTSWLYAPRKCRRRQNENAYGEAWPHEGCAGFRPNPTLPQEKTNG